MSATTRSIRAARLVAGPSLFVLVAGLVVGLVVGCGDMPSRSGGGDRGGSTSAGEVETGQLVPGFDLPRLEGGRVTTADLDGGEGPVVLVFWATWCGPCVREIPTLLDLHRQGAARVVSIALDEPAKIVRPFVEEHGIDYPVLLGDMTTFRRFGGRAIPYTLVLDENLVVQSVRTGLVRPAAFERDLAKARASGGGGEPTDESEDSPEHGDGDVSRAREDAG